MNTDVASLIVYYLTVFPAGMAYLVYAWKRDHREIGVEETPIV